MTVALTPKEVLEQADVNTGKCVPDFVIQVANDYLIKNVDQKGNCTINQNVFINLVLAHPECPVLTGSDNENTNRNYLFDNRCLDIELVFRKAGWKVVYYKPGYNDDHGSANWRFSVPE